jgi:cyclopropane fatty-acyl-phospholipid synthase-like methyltransferase
MTRIISQPDSASAPRISRESVASFFKQRAEKANQLGHIQAVIYQDKNPDLALKRDAAEKAKLLPLLRLTGKESVLDVGCGTGRWADVIAPLCSQYLGTDFSQELVDIASVRFASNPKVEFRCVPSEKISISSTTHEFQIILSLGLFIYLNDDELLQTIQGYASVAATTCRILVREPVGTQARLTIQEHFSEDMDQVYNAIYRTEAELMDLFNSELSPAGFRLADVGDVYESALNNRSDTKQKWFLLERS